MDEFLAEIPFLSAQSFEQFGCFLCRTAMCHIGRIDGSWQRMAGCDVLQWPTELGRWCGGGRVAADR